MKFIGFNYNKILIDKKDDVKKGEKVNTNIDINSIEKVESNLLNGSDKIIQVKFTYNINYEPNFVKIEFKGNVLFSAEEDVVEKIMESWKDKKLEDEFKIFLFNIILRKSNIKALQLEDEFSLPPHVPLPSIKKEDMVKKESN